MLFFFVQLLDGFDTTADNVEGKLIPFMEVSGFSSVSETARFFTPLGILSTYKAHKLSPHNAIPPTN